MSADSPRRGVQKEAQVVSPQPVVDRSIINSVAGIINDIVPQVGKSKHQPLGNILITYILFSSFIGLCCHTKF